MLIEFISLPYFFPFIKNECRGQGLSSPSILLIPPSPVSPIFHSFFLLLSILSCVNLFIAWWRFIEAISVQSNLHDNEKRDAILDRGWCLRSWVKLAIKGFNFLLKYQNISKYCSIFYLITFYVYIYISMYISGVDYIVINN